MSSSVVSTGVRRFGLGIVLAVTCVVAGCGQPGTSPSTSTAATVGGRAPGQPRQDQPGARRPARRIRGGGPRRPRVACSVLGLRARLGHRTAAVRSCWQARPPTTRRRKGWSGSGPGGIVHAVVTGSPTSPVTFDPVVLGRMRAVDGGIGKHHRHRQPHRRPGHRRRRHRRHGHRRPRPSSRAARRRRRRRTRSAPISATTWHSSPW